MTYKASSQLVDKNRFCISTSNSMHCIKYKPARNFKYTTIQQSSFFSSSHSGPPIKVVELLQV